MIANFMRQLEWGQQMPRDSEAWFLGMFLRVFLEEINTWIGEQS